MSKILNFQYASHSQVNQVVSRHFRVLSMCMSMLVFQKSSHFVQDIVIPLALGAELQISFLSVL